MKFKLWPRTLVVQLIAVTAIAVALSNAGVAFWYERGTEQQNETAADERVLDRAAAVATTLGAIPQENHQVVMNSMSLPRLWRFREVPLQPPSPMDEKETGLAQRLTAALPEEYQHRPVNVQLNESPRDIPANLLPTNADPGANAIWVTIPISKTTQLSAVLLRNPPGWPTEIIIAALVAILVSSLGATLLARRVVRPLSELTKAAALVARGGATPPRVEEQGPDDVRNAAIAFNKMTGDVTRTLETQRHLLSAVGHDLRTPITAMRINLEFIEEDDLRDRLMENLDELQALTEQVLSAARGTGGETKRNVDLSALVESLIADLDDMGEPVVWNNHEPAPVTCRPNEIRRAVRNLVENAVAYGSKAEVKIAENDNGYDVVVEDEGPGIPDGDRQRVFEPFVRLESSRNAATGGTGLGLTLVKAIVEGHGGEITLENRETGGLRARMHLPRMVTA